MRSFPDVGDQACDATLIDGNGVRAQLSSQWADRPAVIVFLRYFGCPFCQAQVVSLRRDRELFEAAGAHIVMVGQGEPDDCGEFCDPARVPFTVLLDPDRAAFGAYQLAQARPLQFLAPRTALPWVRLQLDGETRQRGMRGGSIMQLAGTFVVDRSGQVRMAHRSRHIADSPGNRAILRVLSHLTTPTGTDAIASSAEHTRIADATLSPSRPDKSWYI
jgi:peroxiredoxin